MANEKILVVDDDANICELLRLYLTKEGYQVTVANDGEEGLEKFNAVKPDMVLLDVMMPRMDGLDVCRRIAEGHGGRMVLDSRPDQGTSVTLAMPDEMAEDTVEDVQFDYAGGFQPALVGLADALPYQAFLQKHSDD